jgi:hypothetical protein
MHACERADELRMLGVHVPLSELFRGVGTRGPRPPPKFSENTKVPSLLWQSALCLREKCCSENNLQFLTKVPLNK